MKWNGRLSVSSVFIPAEGLVVGVGKLKRQRVLSGLELHRRLLLRLSVMKVRGVEGDSLTLLDVRAVHHDVVVTRILLQALRGGRNLAIQSPRRHQHAHTHSFPN